MQSVRNSRAFGARIRELRKVARLTQEQVAAKLLKGSFVGLKGNFGSVLKGMQKSVDASIKTLAKQIEKAG